MRCGKWPFVIPGTLSGGRWHVAQYGIPSVWKVHSGGGQAVKIADHGYFPLEAPDGEHVYFVRDRRLWHAKSDGSEQEKVEAMPQLGSFGDEWFPFQSDIYFVAHEGEQSSISRFDLATRRVQQVYRTEKSTPDWVGGTSRLSRWQLSALYADRQTFQQPDAD